MNERMLADMNPAERKARIAELRAMGMEGRSRLMLEMNERAREEAKADIRARHPDYDERKVIMALVRQRFGDKLFHEIYGDVDVEI